jgi:hypothetical protein
MVHESSKCNNTNIIIFFTCCACNSREE